MAQRTKKSAKCKAVVYGVEDRVFVGLDVHKKSYHAAVRINGSLGRTTVLPPTAEAVLALLEPYRAAHLEAVYEAGPTGFGLVRALRKAGVKAEVIAPSKTPRAPGQENKTDRLDCRHLALYAEKGMLRSVAVPTAQEEADRQIIRLRDQGVDARRRLKQQIKSFLLQHGLTEPQGLDKWSKASVAALHEMTLAAALRFCLDVMLNELAQRDEQLGQVNRAIENLSREPRHASTQVLLRRQPGVGVITAMQYRTELFRPERFTNERQVAAYLGLAPRVSQSGERLRTGPLLKAGRGRLRALLIEAAWRWIQVDDEARAVYRRLVQNTGQPNKAITGMARRLAIRLWRTLVPPEARGRAA
jgi:transposase